MLWPENKILFATGDWLTFAWMVTASKKSSWLSDIFVLAAVIRSTSSCSVRDLAVTFPAFSDFVSPKEVFGLEIVAKLPGYSVFWKISDYEKKKDRVRDLQRKIAFLIPSIVIRNRQFLETIARLSSGLAWLRSIENAENTYRLNTYSNLLKSSNIR